MDFFSFVHIDQLFQIYFSVWTINYLQSFQPVKNKCITDFYIAQVFDRHFFHVKFFLFAAVATVREWKYARNYINYGQLNIQPNQQRMCRIFFFALAYRYRVVEKKYPRMFNSFYILSLTFDVCACFFYWLCHICLLWRMIFFSLSWIFHPTDFHLLFPKNKVLLKN